MNTHTYFRKWGPEGEEVAPAVERPVAVEDVEDVVVEAKLQVNGARENVLTAIAWKTKTSGLSCIMISAIKLTYSQR